MWLKIVCACLFINIFVFIHICSFVCVHIHAIIRCFDAIHSCRRGPKHIRITITQTSQWLKSRYSFIFIFIFINIYIYSYKYLFYYFFKKYLKLYTTILHKAYLITVFVSAIGNNFLSFWRLYTQLANFSY